LYFVCFYIMWQLSFDQHVDSNNYTYTSGDIQAYVPTAVVWCVVCSKIRADPRSQIWSKWYRHSLIFIVLIDYALYVTVSNRYNTRSPKKILALCVCTKLASNTSCDCIERERVYVYTIIAIASLPSVKEVCRWTDVISVLKHLSLQSEQMENLVNE